MEINCNKLGGSYGSWGMKKAYDYSNVEWGFDKLGEFGEEDDFLNRMSFSGYQMLYETVNCIGNGSLMCQGQTLFNDFVGFGDTSLPEDPFCMNIRSTLNTISDWFHENQMDLVSDPYDEPIGSMMLQQRISSLKMNDFEGLSEEFTLPEDPFCMKVRSTLNTISGWFHENRRGLLSESHNDSIDVVDQMLFESLSLFYNPTSISQQKSCSTDLNNDAAAAVGGPPHDAFELVLPYLEMKEILAVEGVCRSLRDSVRKEPFYWRTIDFDGSFLKYRVTDDSLLKLACRARGNLQCLNLGGCVGITDYGLKQVLASNPHLTKLSVSGCFRLSTAGLLSTLRDLKSSNRLRVKSLITGGALYFTKEQFKELKLLLGADAKAVPKSRKQRFYTSFRSEFSLEDDQVTDLEICPRCEKPSLVFDCPETCLLKDYPCLKSSCRACVVCIERCHECGSCLNDCEIKPFCFAFSCVVCIEKRSNQL